MSRMPIKFLVFVFALSILVTGCKSIAALPFLYVRSAGLTYERPPEFEELDGLSRKEQEVRFLELPDDRQYEAYMYAMRGVHPPDLHYESYLARRGAAFIPFLIEKLKKDASDTDTKWILRLLKGMRSVGTYNTRDDEELAVLLEERVALISTTSTKEEATEDLEYLLESRPPR